MRHFTALLAVGLLALGLAACGGGSSSNTTTTTNNSGTVTVTPSTTTAVLGSSIQFTAALTSGSASPTWTWQVNGTTGGAAATGTISTSGVYTAPAAVPNPSVVTITAVSQKSASDAGSASVTVVSPVPIAVPPPAAVISPSFATLPAGAKQVFTATLNGQPAPVVWSLQCSNTNVADCGSIDANGNYSAPLSPPISGRLNVVATPTDPTAKASSVAVDIQFSLATLNGVYVFSAAGSGPAGFLAEAGAVRFDGSGAITAGAIDSSVAASTSAVSGGSYQLGIAGRGTAFVQTAAGNETWKIVMVNHAHGFWLRFDGSGRQASGSLDLQDATPAIGSISGQYSFTLDGVAAGGATAVAWAGALTADGAGNIARGTVDASDGTSITSAAAATGTYTAPSALGRGTLTVTGSFGAQTLAYYVVNNKKIKLLESDATRVARGELVLAPAGPFTAASLASGFGFFFAGANNHHPAAAGGVVVADGAGGFRNGSFDLNDNGTVTTEQALSGSYVVTDGASGRTTATLTAGGATQHVVMYPRTDGGWNLLRSDANTALHGLALPQAGQANSLSTLTGSLAINLDGAVVGSSPAGTGVVGQLTLAASDTFGGVFDASSGAALTADGSLQTSGFAVKANGRGSANYTATGLGSGTLAVYVLDANTAIAVELDGARTLTGILQRQY